MADAVEGEGHPDAQQVFHKPQGVAIPAPPPPQSRARPVFGVQLQVGRPFAMLRDAKRGSVHVRRTRLWQPRTHHRPHEGCVREWRRKPVGPGVADLRQQHLEQWCGRTTVAAPLGLLGQPPFGPRGPVPARLLWHAAPANQSVGMPKAWSHIHMLVRGRVGGRSQATGAATTCARPLAWLVVKATSSRRLGSPSAMLLHVFRTGNAAKPGGEAAKTATACGRGSRSCECAMRGAASHAASRRHVPPRGASVPTLSEEQRAGMFCTAQTCHRRAGLQGLDTVFRERREPGPHDGQGICPGCPTRSQCLAHC